MRKIILTGAVLAMLTSAAPMVHAQIDPDVQAELNKKVDQTAYDTKIKNLEEKVEKANGLDQKIDNFSKSFDQYKTQNDKEINKKIDETQLDQKLSTHRQSILGDVDDKITQAKTDLQDKITANKKLIQGADGNGGLKGDIKKLQDSVGDNNGLIKHVNDLET